MHVCIFVHIYMHANMHDCIIFHIKMHTYVIYACFWNKTAPPPLKVPSKAGIGGAFGTLVYACMFALKLVDMHKFFQVVDKRAFLYVF